MFLPVIFSDAHKHGRCENARDTVMALPQISCVTLDSHLFLGPWLVSMASVVGWMMAPSKDVHILTPEPMNVLPYIVKGTGHKLLN